MLFSRSVPLHIKTSTLPCFGISSLILSFISLKSMSFPPRLQLLHQWLSITFQSAVSMALPRHNLLGVTLVSTPLPTLISHSTIPVLCWHLCPLFSATSGISPALPPATHVSACTGGPRQSFSTVRGQMLSATGRNEMVKSLGLRQQGIVFCEGLWNLGSRAWRWRAQAGLHTSPHALAAGGFRQVTSPPEPLYPHVRDQDSDCTYCKGLWGLN